jgi:alpha-tubulin suppressor-like RCC1 family protein
LRARVALVAVLAPGCVLVACDGLLGIQVLPDTLVDSGGVVDATTDAMPEASTDARYDTAPVQDAPFQVEAAPDAASLACTTSNTCPTAKPVCSQGLCTAISTLVPGTSNTQCIILTDGTLWCWGWNNAGQLGRGAVGGISGTPTPVSVLPPGSIVQQGATGNDYACALTTNDHAVYCWGTGLTGGGFGTAVKVALPTDAIELSGGSESACARITNNAVYCWGSNMNTDIGCGPDDAGQGPVSTVAPQLLLDSNLGIVHIASGLLATCGTDGSNVYCLGNGQWGSLGGGSIMGNCSSDELGPFENNLAYIVSSDFATCIQTIDGVPYCWGMNYVWYDVGLLDPDNAAQEFDTPYMMPSPEPVPGGTAHISMGWLHGCALTLTGAVSCWGGSTHGETGIYQSSGGVPTRLITGVSDVGEMVAQRQFTCVLQHDGQMLCWGNNVAQIVPIDAGDTPTPTPVVFP